MTLPPGAAIKKVQTQDFGVRGIPPFAKRAKGGHPASQVYVARAPSPATAIVVKAVLRDKGKGRARLQSCHETIPIPNILSSRSRIKIGGRSGNDSYVQ